MRFGGAGGKEMGGKNTRVDMYCFVQFYKNSSAKIGEMRMDFLERLCYNEFIKNSCFC